MTVHNDLFLVSVIKWLYPLQSPILLSIVFARYGTRTTQKASLVSSKYCTKTRDASTTNMGMQPGVVDMASSIAYESYRPRGQQTAKGKLMVDMIVTRVLRFISIVSTLSSALWPVAILLAPNSLAPLSRACLLRVPQYVQFCLLPMTLTTSSIVHPNRSLKLRILRGKPYRF